MAVEHLIDLGFWGLFWRLLVMSLGVVFVFICSATICKVCAIIINNIDLYFDKCREQRWIIDELAERIKRVEDKASEISTKLNK